MNAAPRPQSPEERLTYLETMLVTVSEGIQALNSKLDRMLTALEARASKEWVEKLERKVDALEDEVRTRPTYLVAGAWSAVLGLLGLLAGRYLFG